MKDYPQDLQRRLITLSNGVSGIRAPMSAEIAPDEKLPEITFTASDGTRDRYDEIIEASGWQLANYLRNPVFQIDHYYSVEATVGKAVKVWVESGKLRMTIRFAVGINPMADKVLALYRGGFLNAVSVGFIPRRWENGGDSVGYRRKYLETELVELSAVAVPANPNALQDGLKISSEPIPPANAPAPGGADTTAGLTQTLLEVLAQMRGSQ